MRLTCSHHELNLLCGEASFCKPAAEAFMKEEAGGGECCRACLTASSAMSLVEVLCFAFMHAAAFGERMKTFCKTFLYISIFRQNYYYYEWRLI